MLNGWFDLFRDEGGPTLYLHGNRTAVTADITILSLIILFLTLYLAFLIILPGVRRRRFATFTSVTFSLFIGSSILGLVWIKLYLYLFYSSILVALHGTAWHTGQVDISSAYKAFSREKVTGTLGVHIGLNYVNVTLRVMQSNINYNERFHWISATQMKEEYNAALEKVQC